MSGTAKGYLLQALESQQGYTRLVREVCQKAMARSGETIRVTAAQIRELQLETQGLQVAKVDGPREQRTAGDEERSERGPWFERAALGLSLNKQRVISKGGSEGIVPSYVRHSAVQWARGDLCPSKLASVFQNSLSSSCKTWPNRAIMETSPRLWWRPSSELTPRCLPKAWGGWPFASKIRCAVNTAIIQLKAVKASSGFKRVEAWQAACVAPSVPGDKHGFDKYNYSNLMKWRKIWIFLYKAP
jgi:hypothetical protein